MHCSASGNMGRDSHYEVIPGLRQRVRAKRGPMTGSAQSPESILRSTGVMDSGLAAFSRAPE